MADTGEVIKLAAVKCSSGETRKKTKLRVRAKRNAHRTLTRASKVAKRDHALIDKMELETSHASTHTVGNDAFPIGSLPTGQSSKKSLDKNSTKSNVEFESCLRENLNTCQETTQVQQFTETIVSGNPAIARFNHYANVQVKQEPPNSPSFRSESCSLTSNFVEEYNDTDGKGLVVSSSGVRLQECQRQRDKTKSRVTLANQPEGRKKYGKRSLENVVASIKLKSSKGKHKFTHVSIHNSVSAESERPLKTTKELNNSPSDSSAMAIEDNLDRGRMPQMKSVQHLTSIASSRSSAPVEDNLISKTVSSTHSNLRSSSVAVPQKGYHTKMIVSTANDSHSAALCTQHIPGNYTAQKGSQQFPGNSSNLVTIAPKPNPSYLQTTNLLQQPLPGLHPSVNQAGNNRSCVGRFDAIPPRSTRNVIDSTLDMARLSPDSSIAKPVSNLKAVPHFFLNPQAGNGKLDSVIVASQMTPKNRNSFTMLDSAAVPQTLQKNTDRICDKTFENQESQNYNNTTKNARLILSDAVCAPASTSSATTNDCPNRDMDIKQSSNYQTLGRNTINPQSITNKACNSEVISTQSQLGKGDLVTADVTKSCFVPSDLKSQPSDHEVNAQKDEVKGQTRKKCRSNPAKPLPDNDLLSTNKKFNAVDRDLFSDSAVSEGQANSSEVVTNCNLSKESISDTCDDCNFFLPVGMNPYHRKARVCQLFKQLTDDELKEFALPRLATDRSSVFLPVIYPRILPKPSKDQYSKSNKLKAPNLPLPLEIVTGKFDMPKNSKKPKTDISDEEFLDFVRNKPHRSAKLLNSAEDLTIRKFLSTHLFPEFFEMHSEVLVEMAASMLLELNISQAKYNGFLRKEIGPKLKTVLGYNIFPPLGKVIPLSRKIQEDLRGVQRGRIIDELSCKRKVTVLKKSAKRQKVTSYDSEEEKTELAVSTEEEQDKNDIEEDLQEVKESECFSGNLNSNGYHREVAQESPEQHQTKSHSDKLCQSRRGKRLSSRLNTSNSENDMDEQLRTQVAIYIGRGKDCMNLRERWFSLRSKRGYSTNKELLEWVINCFEDGHDEVTSAKNTSNKKSSEMMLKESQAKLKLREFLELKLTTEKQQCSQLHKLPPSADSTLVKEMQVKGEGKEEGDGNLESRESFD